jgi:DNA polymerase
MGHPLADALQWHIDNGVDVPVGDTPINRTAKAEPPINPPVSANNTHDAMIPALARSAPASVPSGSFNTQKQNAIDAARACQTLEQLREAIRAYDGLDVKRSATNMVFADGNPEARVMVIGEAPGADEDRQGLPFVGVSGQLLDKMFDCIGLNRANPDTKHALYISNILNWRPPGNRTPTDAEIALALPFVERHIAIAKPQFLVLAGAVAAKSVLNMDQPISKLRGKMYDYNFVTPGIGDDLPPFAAAPKILATYHPSFLFSTPVQKRKAWQDLLMLQAAIST